MTNSSTPPAEQLLHLQQAFWQSGFAGLQQVLRGQADFFQSLRLSLPIANGGEHEATIRRVQEQTQLFTQLGESLLGWLDQQEGSVHPLHGLEDVINKLMAGAKPDDELNWSATFWRQQQELMMQVAPAPLWSGAGSAAPEDSAWQSYIRLAKRWSQLITEVELDALKQFQQRSQEINEPEGESLKALHTLWVKCCEESYQNTAADEDFATLYGDLINSVNQLVADSRRTLNEWMNTAGLPNQDDYDELAERYHALRRENRALLAQLEEQKSQDVVKKAAKKKTAGRKIK